MGHKLPPLAEGLPASLYYIYTPCSLANDDFKGMVTTQGPCGRKGFPWPLGHSETQAVDRSPCECSLLGLWHSQRPLLSAWGTVLLCGSHRTVFLDDVFVIVWGFFYVICKIKMSFLVPRQVAFVQGNSTGEFPFL